MSEQTTPETPGETPQPFTNDTSGTLTFTTIPDVRWIAIPDGLSLNEYVGILHDALTKIAKCGISNNDTVNRMLLKCITRDAQEALEGKK